MAPWYKMPGTPAIWSKDQKPGSQLYPNVAPNT